MSAIVQFREIAEKAPSDLFNRQAYLGNEFSFPVINVNLATSGETSILLMKNPAGSGKVTFCPLRRYTSSAEQVLVKGYFNPTVGSAGTPFTPVNFRVASTVSPVTVCTTAPTISVNGTLWSGIGIPADYYVTTDSPLCIILDPGNSLLITATALTANTLFNAEMIFYEL